MHSRQASGQRPATEHHASRQPPRVGQKICRSLANLAKRNLAQLAVLATARLKRMQYRPEPVNGYFAKTGLDLTLSRPRSQRSLCDP